MVIKENVYYYRFHKKLHICFYQNFFQRNRQKLTFFFNKKSVKTNYIFINPDIEDNNFYIRTEHWK